MRPDPGMPPSRCFPPDRPSDPCAFDAALQAVCGGFRVRPSGAGLVRGAIGRRRLGGLDAALVSLDADCVIRDRAMIRRDPGEHMFLICQAEGSSRIIQGGHDIVLRRGHFYLADAAQPSVFAYRGERSRQISLHLPRSEALARFGRACTGGRVVRADAGRATALNAILAGMIDEGEDACAMAEALLTIVAASLWADDRGAEDQGARLYRRALECLARSAFRHGFGLDALAAELGASRRQVQRVFTDHGDTVSGRLNQIRLQAARARLEARADDRADSIAAIAHDCGFQDLSHFYRQFRRQFGTTPAGLGATLARSTDPSA
ncbi:helix-turn-helix domain-containing protein [Paracoccus sp. (in: a-proteobacteria)]|uniref:helix-turn-helix domain-containing protein n=1 Tax=Paracoccus sp. TaxID=267 RepID=UPI0027295946|nr:helix-turn-helix domain-containing protein [Paracoccus sp. (in: a-proteobacteria)]